MWVTTRLLLEYDTAAELRWCLEAPPASWPAWNQIVESWKEGPVD